MVIQGLDGIQEEHDTFTCGHCQRIVRVPPRANPADVGGMCYQCTHLICPRCVGQGCVPFEKSLEAAEAHYHSRRSYADCV